MSQSLSTGELAGVIFIVSSFTGFPLLVFTNLYYYFTGRSFWWDLWEKLTLSNGAILLFISCALITTRKYCLRSNFQQQPHSNALSSSSQIVHLSGSTTVESGSSSESPCWCHIIDQEFGSGEDFVNWTTSKSAIDSFETKRSRDPLKYQRIRRCYIYQLRDEITLYQMSTKELFFVVINGELVTETREVDEALYARFDAFRGEMKYRCELNDSGPDPTALIERVEGWADRGKPHMLFEELREYKSGLKKFTREAHVQFDETSETVGDRLRRYIKDIDW